MQQYYTGKEVKQYIAAYVTSLPVDSVVTKLEQLNLKYNILMI